MCEALGHRSVSGPGYDERVLVADLLNVAESEADLPSAGATEAQYYYGPRRRGYYGYRGYGRPVYRRRCRTFVNRRGRVVRQCW